MCTNHSNQPDLHIKVPAILLIAFCAKFYSFYELIVPKLLSRSKHEEFESNSALQIRDQKERKAENARKVELQEILHVEKLFLRVLFTCLILFIKQPLFTCFLTLHIFVTISCFFPFYPCNGFWFWFFW